MVFVDSITKIRLQLTTIYVEVYLYVKPVAQQRVFFNAYKDREEAKTSLLYLCSLLMRWNPIKYLHEDFTKIRGMMSWCQPLFGPHSVSVNPSESGATAGGSENQLSNPPHAPLASLPLSFCGPQWRQLQGVWEKCDNQRAFRAQSSTGLCPLPPHVTEEVGAQWIWKGEQCAWVTN